MSRKKPLKITVSTILFIIGIALFALLPLYTTNKSINISKNQKYDSMKKANDSLKNIIYERRESGFRPLNAPPQPNH